MDVGDKELSINEMEMPEIKGIFKRTSGGMNFRPLPEDPEVEIEPFIEYISTRCETDKSKVHIGS